MTRDRTRSRRAHTDWFAGQKWMTIVTLPVLIVSMLNGIYGFWGVLFIYWGIISMRAGEVFLVEPIERARHPALFWIISIMWIGSGLLYVWADFAR